MKKPIVFAVALFLCLGASALQAQSPEIQPQPGGASPVLGACPQSPDLFAPAASPMTSCNVCRMERIVCDSWCHNNNWSPPCYEGCAADYAECTATCT